MDKTSFIFHTEWGRLFRRLSDADCKRLLQMMCDYAADNIEPEDTPDMVGMAFDCIRGQMDYDQDRYRSTCEKRRQAVQKRWDKQKQKDTEQEQEGTKNTNVSTCIDGDTKHTDNDIDNDIEIDSDIESECIINNTHTHAHTHARENTADLGQTEVIDRMGHACENTAESKGGNSGGHPFPLPEEDAVANYHPIQTSNQNDWANRPPMQAEIPTLEQVQAYASEQQAVTSPERFYNYFAANGWVDSKNRPIQDWKATFRYWDIQDREKSANKQKPALSPEKAAIYEELTYTPSPLSLQKNKAVSA